LNFLAVWVQVHKIPDGYRGENLVKNLIERKVGSEAVLDKTPHGLGDFIRVRVKLDLRKPLARFVTISRAGQREFFKIQFEKIPRFCGACGLIGHSHLECGSGEHDEDKLKWGDYLKADWDTWFGRGFSNVRGGGQRGGRSGRFGERSGNRGGRDNVEHDRSLIPWRHNVVANSGLVNAERELDDTATSPGKVKDMELDKKDPSNPSAKRSLEMGDLVLDRNHPTDGVAEHQGLADKLMVGKNQNGVTDENTEKGRKKRTKKDGANSSSLGSAESREGSVRSQ
jgi:hypothetical protein